MQDLTRIYIINSSIPYKVPHYICTIGEPKNFFKGPCINIGGLGFLE